MINDIIVIDDAISKNYQDAIEAKIMQDPAFPWYFVSSISKKSENYTELAGDTFGFSHQFYNRNGSVSKITDFLLPLAYEACGHISFTPEQFYYGRAFMTLPAKNKRNILHVDMLNPHISVLYYIHNSTGNTVFVDKTINDCNQDTINTLDNLTIKKEVTPKKGRVVIFDGRFYHASSNPESGRRCIINFNIG